MVDVNTQADVKNYGVTPNPAVQKEDRVKSQVAPVESSGDSGRSALDEKALHRDQQAEKMSKDEMAEYLKEIQSRLNLMGTRLGLDIDDAAETVVARITDKDSGDLIKQIPSEEILELKNKIEDLIGILFDKKA